MSAKDYIDLANLSKDLLVSRRQTEWRINIALWTAMLAIAGFLLSLDEPFSIVKGPYITLYLGYIGVTLLFALWHLPAASGSNRKDLDLIIYFRQKAQKALDEAEPDPVYPEHIVDWSPWEYGTKTYDGKYWHCFVPQGLITVLICIACLAVLYPKTQTSSEGPHADRNVEYSRELAE